MEKATDVQRARIEREFELMAGTFVGMLATDRMLEGMRCWAARALVRFRDDFGIIPSDMDCRVGILSTNGGGDMLVWLSDDMQRWMDYKVIDVRLRPDITIVLERT